MKSTRNPIKRNRNIGTGKSGYGQNNKLKIPECEHDKSYIYWERVKDYKVIVRCINGKTIKFLVEKTKRDFIHTSTIDDITFVLSHVPINDLSGIELIVLRQTKRKEEILDGCWGRLAYFATIDKHEGATIFLEAFNLSKTTIKWEKSLTPDKAKELDRLKEDGYNIVNNRKHYVIGFSLESVRATQLYRTLLHEIGHWVDWKTSVKEKQYETENDVEAYLSLIDLYDSKPSLDKETFAHSYADKLRTRLKIEGIIPFNRIVNVDSIVDNGLLLTDFLK